jgi:hypothetical protein
MRGGARKGAGRKPTGRKGILANFILSPETLANLEQVPRGQRSKFVDAAICAALSKSIVIAVAAGLD